MEWSHNLLSEAERAFFRRLSAFAGGWTLEAAEAVCSGGTIEREDVLDLLGGLVDKSLVVAGASTGGVGHYGMLEPIRQYAREKLEESGETDEVQDRHAAFFLALAEEAEPGLAGPQQRLWVERLEREHDNLREAPSRVLEQREVELGLRFGGALWRFWFTRSYVSEGRRWMERVLAGSDPSAAPARVKALEGLGWLAKDLGDSERAEATYEEMLELSRELGDKENIATALNSLGVLAAQRGAYEQATSLLAENLQALRKLEIEGSTATTLKKFHVLTLQGYLALLQSDYLRATVFWEESLALAREVGDPNRVGHSLSNLGYAVLLQGKHERATVLSEEALELAHELGSAGVEIIPEALVNLGLAVLGQGDHERAVTSFKEALAVSQETERKPSVINALEAMASLSASLEEATRAAHLWGASEAAREATGVLLTTGERSLLHEPYLVAARAQLGEATWEEALVEGRTMSLEEAVEYAFSKEVKKEIESPTTLAPEVPSTDRPPVALTPREQEIALLVARGLTNRQVSTELGISERTAGNHVARILSKLGLRSRAQLANWATESRLLTPPYPDQGFPPP